MKLWRPSDVEPLLAELDLKPSRVLGQNFLVDGNILGALVDEAGPGPKDIVLEIGAGLGVLTAPLIERAAKVIAIEKDVRLWQHLDRSFGDEPKLELIHADALDLDLPTLLAGGVTRVASNLPYSVAARILVELASAPARPPRMVVTLQKEVGARLAASPGSKAYGLLSVFVQLNYTVKICKVIKPTCFLPRPQVTSVMVRLDRRPESLGEPHDPAAFKRLIRFAFSQRRKQLMTILQHAPSGLRRDRAEAWDMLEHLDLDPKARPGELAPENWVAFSNALADGE